MKFEITWGSKCRKEGDLIWNDPFEGTTCQWFSLVVTHHARRRMSFVTNAVNVLRVRCSHVSACVRAYVRTYDLHPPHVSSSAQKYAELRGTRAPSASSVRTLSRCSSVME